MLTAGKESLLRYISHWYAQRARHSLLGVAVLALMATGYAHAALSRSVRAAHLYTQLGHTQWIAFGHGPKILYDVFDPNCPYCHLLFDELKPLIGPDHLTVRAVPVGYLTTTSSAKAAAILMAKDPRKMFLRGETHFSFQHGMQIPLTFPSPAVHEDLHRALQSVVAAAGYAIVPILAYKTKDGEARFVIGNPGPQTLKTLIKSIR